MMHTDNLIISNCYIMDIITIIWRQLTDNATTFSDIQWLFKDLLSILCQIHSDNLATLYW